MSGWSVMTVHPPKSLAIQSRNAAEKTIEARLSSLRPESSDGYAERTCQLPRGTATYAEGDFGGSDVADEMFEEIPEAKWIVITDANDTSDCGTAEVYKRDDGETVGVDTFLGYEGARGRDVVGMAREEYGLDCYVSHEA